MEDTRDCQVVFSNTQAVEANQATKETTSAPESTSNTSHEVQSAQPTTVTAHEACANLFGETFETVSSESDYISHFYIFKRYIIYAYVAALNFKRDKYFLFSVERSQYINFVKGLAEALNDITKPVPEGFYRRVNDDDLFVIKGMFLAEPKTQDNYAIVIFANDHILRIETVKQVQKLTLVVADAILCSLCGDINTELIYKQFVGKATTEEQNDQMVKLLKSWGEEKNIDELVRSCKTICNSEVTANNVCRLIVKDGILLSVIQKSIFRLRRNKKRKN